jgi:hypothetical protein
MMVGWRVIMRGSGKDKKNKHKRIGKMPAGREK